MKNILFITDLHGGSRIPIFAGVIEEAAKCGFHAEEIELLRLKAEFATVLDFWQPAGCIVEGSGNIVPDYGLFEKRGIPVVFIDATPEQAMKESRAKSPFHAVVNDDMAIAEMALKELIASGARDFAFVGWTKNVKWSYARQHAFAGKLTAIGKTPHVLNDSWTLGNKSDFVPHLLPFLRKLPPKCGIFAVNDYFATVILDLCAAEGFRVPGDFTIVGVDDDSAICDHTHPTLTSIHPNFVNAGRVALRMLVKLIETPDLPEETATYTPLGVTRRLSTRQIADNTSRKIYEAIDYIRREACNGLTANDVVSFMGMPIRSAFSKFKAATGKSIIAEILNVRMEKVFSLLSKPSQAIEPIANACGWGSSIYLKRYFKRRTGMTMKEWRKSHLDD